MLVSVGVFLPQTPLLDTRTESHQGGRKSNRVHLPVSLTLVPDFLQSTSSSPSSSSAVKVGTLPNSFRSMEKPYFLKDLC